MPNDIRSSIEALASTFAASIVAAIRGANLDDILSMGAERAPAAKRGPGGPRKRATEAAAPAAVAVKRGPGRPKKIAAEAPAVAAPSVTPTKRGPGRPKKAAVAPAPSMAPKKVTKGGRLARRSQAQIEKALGDVVALLRKSAGLRAEQIRAELGLEPKEMPRILAEGLTSKKLTKKGEKRATAYSAR